MYLKTLEIQGFKSFADRVTIKFMPGIISVVGPNGSGKSNISDAVRWVMGEQSVRLLRGSKMQDVIFAGTENRKPVGFAEVSITFDNSDKALPIEFEEVTIKRRVYRSGESEFFINNSSCRLKDIYELFMDTGIGKDGYSIIGQGRIDEILSTKADDRRHIFEEAAGITKYRTRKQEAEKKLNLTEQNLIRIKDIILELEGQLGPLKKQSEKAKEYLELKETLKVLEVSVFLENIDKLKHMINETNENYNIVNEQLKKEEEDINIQEENLEKLYKSIKETDELIEKTKLSLHNEENLINTNNNKINIYLNNIKNSEANIKRIENDITSNVSSSEGLKAELKKIQEALNKLTSDKQESITALHLLEEKKNKSETVISNVNTSIENIKSEILEGVNRISSLKSKQDSFKVLNNNLSERKASIKNELTDKQKEREQLEIQCADLKNKKEALNETILRTEKELNQIIKKLENAKKEYISASERYDKALATLKEKISRKSFLEEMERTYEGYSKSVKNILKEFERGNLKDVNIFGTLSQLITVPENIVTAIEMALGNSMQNIVVKDEYDAKRAIEFLKENNLGRATFLPISSVKGRRLDAAERQVERMQGFIGVAAELLEYAPEYKDIVYNLLGRVVIVDNIDSGIRLARKSGYTFKIVTLQGDIFNAGGSLTGGSTNKTSGLLSRASEILKLDKDISSLEATLRSIKEICEKTGQDVDNLKKHIDNKKEEIDKLKADNIKVDAEIRNNNILLESLMKTEKSLNSEESQLKNDMDDIACQIKELDVQILKLQEEIANNEELVHLRQEEFKNEINEREEINQQINDKKLSLNLIEKDINIVTEKIDNMNKDINRYEEIIDMSRSEKNELSEQINQFSKFIVKLKEKNNEINKNINDKKIDIDKYMKDKSDREIKIQEIQKILKEKKEKIIIIREEHRRTENKKIKLDMELETTINKLWDEYNYTYSSALEHKIEISNIKSAQKQIEQLKSKIRELGEVNVNALEEYKNLKSRYEFLTKQRDDLEKAKRGLNKVIEEMLTLMEKRFYDQFKIINKNFNTVFKELFNGGRAELKLSEPENVLESGIEIEAQPPGKKLQNIELLSGGERAFTAIALLFAMLKIRPVPFCILDEIEATLDDVNIYRFARYLKKYSEKTQFILVTHRRGTMEASDILYGVTMQEKGVSGLISLNMSEIAN